MAPQREWFEKDYYRVLGVSDTASQKDIKSAYRKLVAPVPPRRQPRRRRRRGALQGGLGRLRRGRRRREAQGVRRGPQAGPDGRHVRRRRRPGAAARRGRVPVRGRRRPRRRARRPVRPRAAPRARRRPGPRHRARTAGQDLEAELHLAFEDAVQGLTTTIHLTSEAACSTCHGTGAAPGHHARRPARSARAGRARRQPGLLQLLPAVPELRRPGLHHRRPVPDLPGHRRRAPAPRGQGPHPGRRRRRPAHPAQGPGRPGPQRRPARRPLRDRPGRPAPAVRPARATTSRSPCRSRSPRRRSAPTSRCRRSTAGPVTLRIPAGTRSGRTLPGQGQGRGRAARRTGDLLVTVEVAVPQKLTDDERKAVEALAAAADGRSPRAHLGVEEG